MEPIGRSWKRRGMAQPDRVLKALGAALADARRDRGMTQETLSLATGIHRNYIGGIERGERSPTVATIAVLADALSVSLGDLFVEADSR
ncbi:MAG: helix-turn-helix transcriptional regulator [Solirubrobacterales bacterium]